MKKIKNGLYKQRKIIFGVITFYISIIVLLLYLLVFYNKVG